MVERKALVGKVLISAGFLALLTPVSTPAVTTFADGCSKSAARSCVTSPGRLPQPPIRGRQPWVQQSELNLTGRRDRGRRSVAHAEHGTRDQRRERATLHRSSLTSTRSWEVVRRDLRCRHGRECVAGRAGRELKGRGLSPSQAGAAEMRTKSERSGQDPDDAPEITQVWIDGAHLYHRKKLIRRGTDASPSVVEIRERLARRPAVMTRIAAAEVLRRERKRR